MDGERFRSGGGLQVLMRYSRVLPAAILYCALLCPLGAFAQDGGTSEVRLHIVLPSSSRSVATPAVVWLKPIAETSPLPFPARRRYTLLQKHRMFSPHLLVIPVGSTVDFPNADPFFHNVFSLFDGKRFDLGLYEAGSDKQVVFSREGVSYIFCNIHPEMSAVVLALSTPLYAIADASESVTLHSVPDGDYMLNVWVEGVPQTTLSQLARKVRLTGGVADLGSVSVPVAPTTGHTNKFGEQYDTTGKPPY
jgi:hypothetical protein